MKIKTNPHARLATVEDLNYIVNLWKEDFSNHHVYDQKFFDLQVLDRDDYLNTLQNAMNDQTVFVLIVSGNVGGYAIVDICPYGIINYNDTPLCIIDDFIIAQRYKTMNSGNKLLKEIIKHAKEAGCQRIDFKAHAKDRRAMEFFNKKGFNPRFCDLTFEI